MAMHITISGVHHCEQDVWGAISPPRDVRTIGVSNSNYGDVSVIMLEQYEFDATARKLSFAPRNARVLNVGNSDSLIIIAAHRSKQLERRDVSGLSTDDSSSIALNTVQITADSDVSSGSAGSIIFGPGDQEFLNCLNKVPNKVALAGRHVLKKIREHFPGDLKQHGNRSFFVETPDNFWTVTVQPRVQALEFTVRGDPSHFETKQLSIRSIRAPYSAFKVTSVDDVDEAVSVIKYSKQRVEGFTDDEL